jgi:hypothetical protein
VIIRFAVVVDEDGNYTVMGGTSVATPEILGPAKHLKVWGPRAISTVIATANVEMPEPVVRKKVEVSGA